MKLSIKIYVLDKKSRSTILIEATPMHVNNITDHDLAGLLFACEFAINYYVSEMYGKSVRAHINMIDE